MHPKTTSTPESCKQCAKRAALAPPTQSSANLGRAKKRRRSSAAREAQRVRLLERRSLEAEFQKKLLQRKVDEARLELDIKTLSQNAHWTSLPVGVVTLAERFKTVTNERERFDAMSDFTKSLIAPFAATGAGACLSELATRANLLLNRSTLGAVGGDLGLCLGCLSLYYVVFSQVLFLTGQSGQ